MERQINMEVIPMQAITRSALLLSASLMVACGGGSSSTPTPSPPIVVAPPPAPGPTPSPPPSGKVTVSGNISYERPTPNLQTAGLDFSDIQTLPIRGARLQAINTSGVVVAETLTNMAGAYALDVDAGTSLRIRALSQTIDGPTDAADWDLAVVDNTNSNAVYNLQGSLADTGNADQTRNLLARTGADSSGNYVGPRVAAPFAILDDTYTAIQTVTAVDPDVILPEVQLRFSVDNKATSGNRTIGEIGTSSYVTQGSDRAVYILGDAGVDTDEFDSSVIVHEWGHYFEDRLSRSDSIGGPHSLRAILDKRIALGEGFGNALSGIVLEDPIYRDTSGVRESRGFTFSLENERQVPGWFSEASVQNILYDIADAEADAGDTLSEGFGPIYNALLHPDYVGFDGFVSIFALAETFRNLRPELSAGIDTLLEREEIAVTDAFGSGETNSPSESSAGALPIYLDLEVGGPAQEFCSRDDLGEYNRVLNRQFFLLEIASAQTVNFTMTKISGFEDKRSDPDFFLYREGRPLLLAQSGDADTEVASLALDPGIYAMEAYEFANIDIGNANQGDVCFRLVAR